MFRNILVPLDGSQFAESAIPLACRLAQIARARIHLVLVHRPAPVLVGVGEVAVPPLDFGEELRTQEANYLADITADLQRKGIGPVEFHEADGLAGPELCEAATRLHADLIVMATHGRGGVRRYWLGSVADYLVRHLSTPLLLVHPGQDVEPQVDHPIRGLLVALDLSKDAEAILEPVTALAQLTRAHVTLVHAVGNYLEIGTPMLPSPLPQDPALLEVYRVEAQQKLDAIAAQLREHGVSVAARIVSGASAATQLLDMLNDACYDLIALTTHGAGGVRRLLLGSVADKVIRRASKPVLVLRPPPSV